MLITTIKIYKLTTKWNDPNNAMSITEVETCLSSSTVRTKPHVKVTGWLTKEENN